MTAMLKVEGVNQYYGGSHILRNVGFEAKQGEVTVVLGRNGVGKTTLLKSLLGVVPVRTGTIALDGWSHWSRIQVSRSPGLPMAFGSLAVGVLGLCLSLFIRPRRLWLRVRDDADDNPRVEVGGLDRADARTGLSDDVDDLLASTRATNPTALTEQETP